MISNPGRYICLYAMVLMDEFMVKKKFKTGIVMQVHDSIDLDIYLPELDDVIEISQRFMVDAMMKYTEDWMDPIPLVVDGFIGPNWWKGDKTMEVELR